MNRTVRAELLRRQRRIQLRLQRDAHDRGPMLSSSSVKFETSDRMVATSAGGVRLVHELVKVIGLQRAIDEHVDLLKVHRPYHDSDHVLAMAYNLLAPAARASKIWSCAAPTRHSSTCSG